MSKQKRRIFAGKILMVRLYILGLALLLVLSLLALTAGTVSAKTDAPSGDHRVTVRYRGKTIQVRAAGETAGELLQRLGLEVTGEDVVSQDMEEVVCPDRVLQVDRVVTAEETYTVTLPHEISCCNDPSVPEGMEEVLTEGEDGELLCRAKVTYVNGLETERQVLSQTVTKAPVTEVIGIGTGEPPGEIDPGAMPVISDGYITLPTGEVLTYTGSATVRATAYTHTDEGCDGITSTGTQVHWGTVAVDPRYIPYGTRMFIVASNGSFVYGIAVAEDCGGDIKGDRMDLYMPTYEQCMEFGRRVCTLYYLG